MTKRQLTKLLLAAAAVAALQLTGLQLGALGAEESAQATETDNAAAVEPSPATTALDVIAVGGDGGFSGDAPQTPVQGATVLVRWTAADGEAERSMTTNSHGVASFADVKRGTVTVQVIANEYETFGKKLELTGAAATILVPLVKANAE